MTEEKSNEAMFDEVPEAEVQVRKRSFSIVWLVPLVAVIIGGWLVYKTLSEKGPTITITFKSAEGLEAGKTKIRYKDVELGQVSSIILSEDLSHVIVTAELVKEAEAFVSEHTRFWVVRARVEVGGISGLGTLFSGAYITLDPGRSGRKARHFEGLEKPPLVTTDLPGRHFLLNADSRGSLEVGSPVFYRKIQVGQIVEYNLADDGNSVIFKVFINAPYHQYVYRNSRFWNSSGVDVKVDAQGIRLDTESVVSILIGGIAFGIPHEAEPGPSAEADHIFTLFKNMDVARERIYAIKHKSILYFDESVRGLALGAPVEFWGIQMGQVLDIKLEFEPQKKNFRVRVVIEIETERFIEAGVVADDTKRKELLQYMVQRGFRAQLKTGNLITGKQMIVLDFFPDAPPAEINFEDEYPVFPTVPTAMEEISAKIMRIMNRIDQLPIEQIGKDLKDAVHGAKQLAESPELLEAVRNVNATLQETRMLISDLRTRVTPEIGAALDKAQQSLAAAERMMNADSPLQVKMKSALDEISGAARGLRILMDYLERHPEALLRGKGPE